MTASELLPGAHRAGPDDVQGDERPLVSMILTTRDRPRLFSVALRCYQHQTYPRRELVVVDDGDRFPVDERAVAALGGRLVRADPGTALGTKLNLGAQAARGGLCQKMDDDDWYAPAFLETMVGAIEGSGRALCLPTVAFVTPFLFFEVARWEVRRSVHNNVPGATLLFARDDWEGRPFRPLPGDEDVWFFMDQQRRGTRALPVRAPEIFLAVRHRGSRGEREHTWVEQWDGQRLESYLKDRELYPGGPEALLPEWALDFYGELRRELLATAKAP
jgi:glycosyltransferase involved in cell wall biosynthesis